MLLSCRVEELDPDIQVPWNFGETGDNWLIGGQIVERNNV